MKFSFVETALSYADCTIVASTCHPEGIESQVPVTNHELAVVEGDCSPLDDACDNNGGSSEKLQVTER